MKLSDGTVGSSYYVKELKLPKQQEMRLAALGVTQGTQLVLLNKKAGGSVIFKVRGTRLAIGRKIAGSISVQNEQER